MMIAFETSKTVQKVISIARILVILLPFSLLLQPEEAVQANLSESIGTLDLNISIKDIARMEFGYHESSFESHTTEYKLDVKAGQLTDGKVKAPLSNLNLLVSGLQGMYPGTQPLTWQRWTDDYPFAWIYLYLQDGRLIQISSDSQFEGMFPWNVTLYGSEKTNRPDATYVQLHPALLDGIDTLWRTVGEKGFPRKHYEGSFYKEVMGDPPPETIKFNIPRKYASSEDDSNTAPVWGSNPASLDPFLPMLRQNSEIQTLLDAGYSLYDAAFTLEVKTKDLEPLQYSGTLAIAAPDGEDAVVGLVTIPLANGKPVTTSLKAADTARSVKTRKARQFLNDSAKILTPLTYLLDTRDGVKAPTLDCPGNPNISPDGQALQAIWNRSEPERFTFYPLTDGRWTLDLGLQRDDPNWDDTLVQTMLKAWFPEAFASLPIQDLQAFDTHWKIAFQPNVTLRDLGLLNRLKSFLPQQTIVHAQDPDKAGDYSFLSLAGRTVISENGDAPDVVYCGVTLPEWYGAAYPVNAVIPPNDQAPRIDVPGGIGKNGEWRKLSGPLPSGNYSSESTGIAFTQPGFLHVLWTNERDGVYYSDGWINGTGWSKPQRLGEPSYWVDIRAWPDGEIHLFWDAGLVTQGTIHVWRPAGGTWQKAELWPISYFSQILRDPNGVIHIGGLASDGLDYEFMHWTWTSEKGLSAPENISRHIGDIGNTTPILRFDSKGQLHAAWSHILEQKSAPDPLTGETSDISGVFYARQLPDGHWSKPEQVGTLGTYTHALSMELDAQENPLIVWQGDSGLFSRIKKNGTWEDPVTLAKVTPPVTPAEFGADRWVQPTAALKTGVNSSGQIIVGWLIPLTGLKMAFWSDAGWKGIVDIVPSGDRSALLEDPQTLEMAVDIYDRVHFVFFKDHDFYYACYDHGQMETNHLSMTYDLYGIPEASLAVDTLGSVAVMELPRSPGFDVKMPVTGIPPTPTPTITPTTAPKTVPTTAPTPAPTATPKPLSSPEGGPNLLPYLLIGFGFLTILVMARVAMILRKKRSVPT
jgi:hypothetical protein